MRVFSLAAAGLCAGVLCAGVLAAAAQERPTTAQPPAESTSPSNSPELADLMGITQLRHIKLSYAGGLKNWDLAAYELGLIRKSFEAAARLYPEVNGVRLAKLVDDVSKPALDEIGKAVAAKKTAAFSKAFKDLTEACNSCHRAAKVGFVVIRVPTTSPFSNQSFAPSP